MTKLSFCLNRLLGRLHLGDKEDLLQDKQEKNDSIFHLNFVVTLLQILKTVKSLCQQSFCWMPRHWNTSVYKVDSVPIFQSLDASIIVCMPTWVQAVAQLAVCHAISSLWSLLNTFRSCVHFWEKKNRNSSRGTTWPEKDMTFKGECVCSHQKHNED